MFRILGKITKIIDPENQLPFEYDGGWHKLESNVEKGISEFLEELKLELQDENLKDICDYELVLFEESSEKFFELCNLTKELEDIVTDRPFFKVYSESKNKIDDIVAVIDEIITIQEAIIVGPHED